MGLHEKLAEKFFGHGVENWDTYHGGYLNFGLWENGITDYIDASENLLTRVAEKIKLNKNSLLLDVGCGSGAQDRFFAKKFKCKSIHAVDLTTKHIEMAKRKLKNSRHENQIKYSVGDACKLTFKNKSFTHITGIEAPVNFNTREKFFKQAYRMLKKNGRLGISDFYLKNKPKTIFGKLLIMIGAKIWHLPKANHYGLKVYQKKLEKAGFTDVELEPVEDNVVPGYYFEQRKKSVKKQLKKIRGTGYILLGPLLNYAAYKTWKMGILGYVLVDARKP